jgi:transcriptional regulator of acetoin/glycerol metabolism
MFNLEEIEKEVIIKAFIYHRGNRNIACKALGISRANFYVKIKKYGINLKELIN